MGKLKNLYFYIKTFGPRKTCRFVLEYLFSNQKILKSFVINKRGLEIGGPSKLFFSNNSLPIYPYVKSLDNVNFRTETLWNKKGEDGVFSFENRTGKQLIMEASDLRNIESESY